MIEAPLREGRGHPPRRVRRAVASLAIGFSCALVTAPGWPRSARADDFYVDGGNSGCSDSGPGSAQAPYCSISAALAAHHAPGTTIHVMPGIYREQVTLGHSGRPGSPIVLRAEGGPDHPAIIDGSDDFSSLALWAPAAGTTWVAASVTWEPGQVFVDGARLEASSAPPESLSAGAFAYVAGAGLFVNLGGANPGTRAIAIGRRAYGFYVSARSWVTIDGFAVTSCENRGIMLTNGSTNLEITRNVVHQCGHVGLQAAQCAAVHIGWNKISDNADHGISVTDGTVASTIEGNESFGNFSAGSVKGAGLYLFGTLGNVIRGNRFHDNAKAGEDLEHASGNVSLENVSWNNRGAGYNHLAASGNVHNGDVAFGNNGDGFGLNMGSTGTAIYNCVSSINGLRHSRFDLEVDSTSVIGFTSDDNLFWNPSGSDPMRYAGVSYNKVREYATVSGQDARTLQSDPRFADPQAGDFRPLPGSPLIDSGNSATPDWSSADAAGNPRIDDPSTANRGRGPVLVADRGAFEYAPSLWSPTVGDTVPRLDHIIVVIMENKPYDLVRTAPYTESLISRFGSFSNSYSYQHQSQSDYYAIWSAVGRGVTESICPAAGSPYDTENLGHRCEADGVTWKSYAEGLPAAGDTVCQIGMYVRRHCPWADWGNLNHANERPYGDLATDIGQGTLPSLAFVIPNICDDTHNECGADTILFGDIWLANNLPAMIDGVGSRGLVIVTWDEDDGSDGNHILTVFASPLAKSGYVSKRYINHFVVCRTICDGLGISSFAEAAGVDPITDIWSGQGPGSPPPPPPPDGPSEISLGPPTPNPFRGATSATLELPSQQLVNVAVFDLAGRRVKSLLEATRDGLVQVRWDGTSDGGVVAPAGIYLLRVRVGGTSYEKKLVMVKSAGR